MNISELIRAVYKLSNDSRDLEELSKVLRDHNPNYFQSGCSEQESLICEIRRLQLLDKNV